MDLIKPTTNRYHFDNIFSEQPLVTENFSIIQIGDLICETDTVVDEHKQISDLEISLICDGEGSFFTNDIETKVKQWDIYLSFKDDLHKIVSSNTDALRYYYFAFDIKESSKYRTIYENLYNKYAVADNRTVRLPFLFSITTNILSEINEYSTYSKELLDTYIIQVLIGLYRNEITISHPAAIYDADLKQGLIQNIIRYIDTNCENIATVSDIAEHFNYDYDYVSKIFKNIMKMSIHSYLQNAKLNKAKLLLAENKSVTDVSVLLNYSSVHNFSRAYKNKFGVTPSQSQKD